MCAGLIFVAFAVLVGRAGFCKDVRFYRIPTRQLYDLRCAAFKVKPQITPFAVVVRLIQVDRGGYFFVPFAALGLFQCHGTKRAGSRFIAARRGME